MKTIIKIVLAILVVTACFNAARAAMSNYQFEDAVHELLLFDPHASDQEIMNFVTKTADQYGVPLDPEDVNIHQVGQDVVVDMSYTESINLIPGVYAHDWTFKPQASARILTGSRR
jgi:hypothetical protein